MEVAKSLIKKKEKKEDKEGKNEKKEKKEETKKEKKEEVKSEAAENKSEGGSGEGGQTTGGETKGADGETKTETKSQSGSKWKKKKRGPLPDTPMDYQIRVHIIEGRSLKGSNIDPVVKLNVWKEKSSSKVKKSTTRPFYDELFFFNFHEAPSKLFLEFIEISVFNAKSSRSDALIGSFTCEIGFIYDEPKHQFYRMWLMLTNPKERGAGVQGYLKVTLCVLGPGDEAPQSSSVTSDENEDIEANLLRPPGMDLEPLDLVMRVYHGEDMPQMDTGLATGLKTIDRITKQADKELCDPYFRVSFAGKSNTTEHKEQTYFPVWNEELHLPLQVPSMCDDLVLQIFDHDRLSVGDGDVIATHILSLSSISMTDEDRGFLPVFGPAYVNFYGAPREHETFDSSHNKKMNLGQKPGCAYRGRVLIDLQLQPINEEIPEKAEIEESQKERVSAYKRKREFMLRCLISEASMINPDHKGKKISFELSIGNRGNQQFEPQGSSFTIAQKPVYDGAYYYALPFLESKPCLEVLSQWEDVVYRFHAQNHMRSIARKLRSHLNVTRNHLEKAIIDPSSATQSTDLAITEMIIAINDLIRDCRKPLPEKRVQVTGINFTKLDVHIQDLREFDKADIIETAVQLSEKLQYKTATIEDIFEDLEVCERRLLEDSIESQKCIPDIVIWMLVDKKRKAFLHVPVDEVIWANNPEDRGDLFGKIQHRILLIPKPPKNITDARIPCMLRMTLWFGSTESRSEWPTLGGTYLAIAETFENQRYIPATKWGDHLTPGIDPPKFSDRKSKKERKKGDCIAPEGWEWAGDWYISPEGVVVDEEAGMDMVVEETWENQRRYPMKGWGQTLKTERGRWTDVEGVVERTRESVILPDGWLWGGDWRVDLTRACDPDGWEYAFDFVSGMWHQEKKKVDFVRRRRWIRERNRDPDHETTLEDPATRQSTTNLEGWEYSIDFRRPFHPEMKSLDVVRRRRWHRERIPVVDVAALAPSGTNPESYGIGCFIKYETPQVFQLRVHAYQARDLLGADKSGLSDPFLVASFSLLGGITLMKEQTLNPLWDQTLVLEPIRLYDIDINDPETYPVVGIEIYDYDVFDDPDLLARAQIRPTFRSKEYPDPVPLEWHKLYREKEYGGELLASFELIPYSDQKWFPLPKRKPVTEELTKKKRTKIPIPNDIRPEMEDCTIEILAWGLRKLAKYFFLSVNKPHIEFECGGTILSTEVLKGYKKFPNFKKINLVMDLPLPVKEEYSPPFNIRVYDNRLFGRKPMVGIHTIRSLQNYRTLKDITVEYNTEDLLGAEVEEELDDEEENAQEDLAITPDDGLEDDDTLSLLNKAPGTDDDIELVNLNQLDAEKLTDEVEIQQGETGDENETEPQERVIDWWSKFYKSLPPELNPPEDDEYEGDTLEYYDKGLENFFDLEDNVRNFILTRGLKGTGSFKISGKFKGNLRVYPSALKESIPSCPWSNLPENINHDMVIRIYIVRACDLQALDSDGKSDPYVSLSAGKKKVNDRKNYIPKTLNPQFGRCYELSVRLPIDSELIIKVYDHDLIGFDELIGETRIDLEDRWLTMSRATVGLAQTYNEAGINKWRDLDQPTDILKRECKRRGWEEPEFSETPPFWVIVKQVKKGRKFVPKPETYENKEQAHQNASLLVLRYLKLVPEHVETRILVNPLQPELAQGQLQLFIDMFPKGPELKESVVIDPRKPRHYELRCVVWDCKEVKLVDMALGNEPMADVYVKGHLLGYEKNKQKTDVHYRSMDGDANFNWRWVFPFDYLPQEKVLVVKKKSSFFSIDAEEHRLPPIFDLSIWDNDLIFSDTFIGKTEFNLLDFKRPAMDWRELKDDVSGSFARGWSAFKKATSALTGGDTQSESDRVNLFEAKQVRGWIPLWEGVPGESEMTAKVDIEFQIVDSQFAEENPVGKGRKKPNQLPHLDPPDRPATSFNWITSPWKSFKYIIWKNYGNTILMILFIVLLVIFLALFLYYAPPNIVDKYVSPE